MMQKEQNGFGDQATIALNANAQSQRNCRC
jgi:hypothetical protein